MGWKRCTSKEFVNLAWRGALGFLPIPGLHLFGELQSFLSNIKMEDRLEKIEDALSKNHNELLILKDNYLNIKAYVYADIKTRSFFGKNISSITDLGIGDISLNFTEPVDDPYFFFINTEDTQIHKTSKTRSSLRIKFFDPFSKKPNDTAFTTLIF